MAKKLVKRSTPTRKKASKRLVTKALAVGPHNVNITDTDENWVAWGKLVLKWIRTASSRPETVDDLRKAMRTATPRVYGDIKGDPTREVQVIPYSGTKILIPIPTDGMVALDVAILKDIADNAPTGQKNYPLPEFYSLIFGHAPKVDMTFDEMRDMALRRLGEYVINECM